MSDSTPSTKRLSGKLLIVDDNEFDAYLLQKQLLEFEIDWFASSERALTLFGDYDLLVIDYLMPGIDGCELIELIREEDKTTPIVLLTGVVNAKLKCQAKDLNVAIAAKGDYFETAELIRRLHDNGRKGSQD